jgi:hemerythrin-like domain-containing protein
MTLPKRTPSPASTAANAPRLLAWGQEMRAVHQRLRDALDIARESIENDVKPESLVANDLQRYCDGFCVALNGHHLSEDATLFPLVLRVQPGLAATVGKLMQDHSMIAHLIRVLEQALRTGDDQGVLLRHLDGIEAVMETHFGFEERQLVKPLDSVDIERVNAERVNAERVNADGLDKTAMFGPIA